MSINSTYWRGGGGGRGEGILNPRVQDWVGSYIRTAFRGQPRDGYGSGIQAVKFRF